MALEQVGLEAIFDTTEFQRGQRLYEQGLNRVNAATKKSADAMSKAWTDPTEGLGDMFDRLGAVRGQADDMAKVVAARGAEAGAGVATGLSLISAAATGVGIALTILGAAGAAVYSKIDDSMKDYLERSKYVIEAQERVNEKWKEAGESVAQALIPLKVEFLELELAAAEAAVQIAESFKRVVAIVHASVAGAIAPIIELNKIIVDVISGEAPSLEEAWERVSKAGQAKFGETMLYYRDVFEETFEETEEEIEEVGTDYEKMADVMNAVFQRIADAQRDHNRKLGDMADDYRHKQERAWQQYGIDIAKEIARGQKKLADITLEYEKDVAEEIEDYNDDRLKAEDDLNKSLLEAQQDYERKAAQDRERFELDEIQGERRYQYERARLVAEGDTLAIEEMDARYKLEQQEAEENEALRVKQAEETQASLVEAMEAAGRAQAEALAEALAEQLKEMEEQSREEMAEQEQANRDRVQEMAAAFAEQQRLADEDYQRSLDKADQNYDRQQEDLGRNLARQEELQELGGDEVANILEQYYGPAGLNREIMDGYYAWLEERAVVSATTMAAAMAMSAAPSQVTPEFHPVFGMQEGGVLRGPAMAYIEPGTTEALVPLSGPGAGGAFTHEFLNALRVVGLESASPADVNTIARELVREITAKIRVRRMH